MAAGRFSRASFVFLLQGHTVVDICQGEGLDLGMQVVSRADVRLLGSKQRRAEALSVLVNGHFI